MGTSVNQRSPETPNWRIVQRAYEDPKIPLERVLQEIWRASTNQPEGDLVGQLTRPIIAQIGEIGASKASPAEVARAVSELVSREKASCLGADIARRAAIQCAGKEDASSAFVVRVIAEATNYLVSRDIPGHISPGKRLATVSDAREFSARLINEAVAQASSVSASKSDLGATVKTIVDRIRNGGAR